MKKLSVLLGIIAIFIGTVEVAITLLTRRAHSVSIIGGADGPTSIFLAGKVSSESMIIGMIIGVLLLPVGIGLLLLDRKRRGLYE